MGLKTQTSEVTIHDMEGQTEEDLENHDPESQSSRRIAETRLHNILRPMLIAMAISGCYGFEDLNGKNTGSRDMILRGKGLISCVQRIVFFIVILLYVAQKVAAFFTLPKEALIFNVLFTVWVLLCFVWFVIFWKASSKRFGKQAAAFESWNDTIMPKFQELNLEYPFKLVHKRVMILLIFGIVLTLGNAASSCIQFAFLEDVSLCTSPLEGTDVVIGVMSTFQTVCSAVWIIPIMYNAAITHVLRHAFKEVSRAISRGLNADACSVPPDFQKLRVLHVHLCSLVAELDHDLGWYYVTLCMGHVGMACFTLYQIIRTSMVLYTKVIYCFWAVSSMAVIVFSTSSAAMLNQEAHAPLDTIYYINVSDVNFEKLAQINLFLSKLTGTQVGFSTCGLLVITKEFILTIAGVFITYFAVLYTL